MKILQLSHGKIIPKYSSAYALRCHSYLVSFSDRQLLSVSGLVLRDRQEDYARQYRSILTLVYSLFRKQRSLEYFISKGIFLRKKYLHDVRQAIKESDVIVFEGPWQYYLFRDFVTEKKVVYDAHNVESLLRKGNIWEEYTYSLERSLSERSDLLVTLTKEDARLFASRYGINAEKVLCIPEGFKVLPKTWNGIDSMDIVFIGSAYLPNIEAVTLISDIAFNLPQFKFKIIGSVCTALRKRHLSPNMQLLGLLTEEQKDDVLNSSFLALNPVTSGSGMNLKMNDYINHGIPIISTEIGARGFDSAIIDKFILAEPGEFKEKILWADKERQSLSKYSDFYLEYVKKECSKPNDLMILEGVSKLFNS